MRLKILRKPGQQGYPAYVCNRCGTYAQEDSKTVRQAVIGFELQRCGICDTVEACATPLDFGWPEFYTYKNGAPVRRSS